MSDAALASRPDPTPEELEDLALRDDYGLNPAYIEMVVDAADRGDRARIGELLDALHPADIADLMGFLTADYRDEVMPCIPPAELADVLSELDPDLREQVLAAMPPAALASALGELDSDDALDVVEDLEDEQRDAVLAALSSEDRAAIESGLRYEEETAGRLMQREVMAAPQFWTVGQTIDHMRANADELPDLFFDIYVVDPAYHPVGAIPVSSLLKARRETALTAVAEPVTDIPVDMDQEEVAYVFEKYHLISAPVVDAGGRLVGQITVDDIVGVVREESEEDILALAQVSDAGRGAGVLDVVRSRLLWLVVNVGTAFGAASVISLFQDEIKTLTALAILLPITASLGGNAGTQALAVSVRALATKELTSANVLQTVGRELGAGLINGMTLAVLVGAIAAMLFQQPLLGVTIGGALIINLIVASLAGVCAPLVLDRFGFDPAAAASVFVTMLTDALGFFSFLGLAALILL